MNFLLRSSNSSTKKKGEELPTADLVEDRMTEASAREPLVLRE